MGILVFSVQDDRWWRRWFFRATWRRWLRASIALLLLGYPKIGFKGGEIRVRGRGSSSYFRASYMAAALVVFRPISPSHDPSLPSVRSPENRHTAGFHRRRCGGGLGRWRAMVQQQTFQGISASYAKEMERLSSKESLLLAVSWFLSLFSPHFRGIFWDTRIRKFSKIWFYSMQTLDIGECLIILDFLFLGIDNMIGFPGDTSPCRSSVLWLGLSLLEWIAFHLLFVCSSLKKLILLSFIVFGCVYWNPFQLHAWSSWRMTL